MMAKLLLSQIATKSTLIKNSGSYPVVISLVALIGTNNTKKYKNLVQVALGFTTKNRESIYKICATYICPSSALYEDLNVICGGFSFLNKDFDLFSILGKQVLLNVIIKNDGDKFYPIIEKMSPLTNSFDASNIDLVRFSFDYIDEMYKIPEWICKYIKNSKEWKAAYE